jgi:2'-5' RNA ligase
MSRPTAKLRLFVAAYPPREAAVLILALLRPLRLADHRPTPPEQLHMTLQFIGDTPESQMAAVRESVERSAAGVRAFSLRPARLMTLPKRGAPRLVALETDLPAGLAEIQRRLVSRLATEPRRERDFTPHMTLCRFSHNAHAADLDALVTLPPFGVNIIHLMRSTLKPEGAEHHAVKSFPLVGG